MGGNTVKMCASSVWHKKFPYFDAQSWKFKTRGVAVSALCSYLCSEGPSQRTLQNFSKNLDYLWYLSWDGSVGCLLTLELFSGESLPIKCVAVTCFLDPACLAEITLFPCISPLAAPKTGFLCTALAVLELFVDQAGIKLRDSSTSDSQVLPSCVCCHHPAEAEC